MKLLQINRVSVRGLQIVIMSCYHRFDLATAVLEEDVFHFKTVLPGLGKEYVQIPKLGSINSTVL
jgi:hypothetical protein